ncbi:MAG: hypothetical protein PHU85_15050, partial [Phycisphaerae bacterium]|nr:hypothetical protein [Phycisphaerae bacterium]
MRTRTWVAAAVLLAVASNASAGTDEFAIRNEQTFEFVEKPTVAKAADSNDRFEIRFATKALCDVTIVIEDSQGRTLRHLASGVLGKNAPAPFAKDTTRQTIVWDGKDDQGVLVDEKRAVTARVSLGLKAQFERTLFWSPKKRIGPGHRPLFASAAEGVYVLEGGGVDHLRLFDHAGNYVRTVYPFPPDYTSPEAKAGGPKSFQAALAKVVGLKWIEFPQDGKLYPEWQGLQFSTLLTSGDNAGTGTARINPT